MTLDTIRRAVSPEATGPTRRPVLVTVADVLPEKVAWLWPGRFAIGKLSLLAGDPGLGKSFVTLDMAARVSTGSAWPDAPNSPNPVGGVILLSAEDDPADTIRPRLDGTGADVSRIKVLSGVSRPGNSRQDVETSFSLDKDLGALDMAVQQTDGCRLVIIDPVTAYLGGVDSHKNADVRALLAPLGQLAARHRVAVIAVSHLNKNAAGPAVYRSMGSLAFTAAARAVWLVVKDRDAPSRRLLLPAKNNLAPDVSGLAYSIQPDGLGGSPVVVWEREPVTVQADEALGDVRGRGTERLADATEWLRDLLDGGKVPARDALREGKENGFSEGLIRKSLKRIGRQTRDGFGPGSQCYWSLAAPDQSP